MSSPASKLSRRNFLLAAGAGSVATAAVITGNSQQAPAKKPLAGTSGKGYHVTEHIRKYYNTAKV